MCLRARANRDPRYGTARQVFLLAQEEQGTWSAHLRDFEVSWGNPPSPGPVAGPAAEGRFRSALRAAAQAQEAAWARARPQAEALQRPAGRCATAAEVSASGATLSQVRAWARLRLQAGPACNAVGEVPACRFCGRAPETRRHLLEECGAATASLSSAAGSTPAVAPVAPLSPERRAWLLGERGRLAEAAAEVARLLGPQ